MVIKVKEILLCSIFLTVITLLSAASIKQKRSYRFDARECGSYTACNWTVCQWFVRHTERKGCFKVVERGSHCRCPPNTECRISGEVEPWETMVKIPHRCFPVTA
ncbi:unnamed protein product [Owenia fusiformis]|uniref:Uncharacterized protein n=1 Tax=Owenia fusiformis TaxID=6347 RepID=A0A8S4N0J5_OWEFU|nr:unnamed protein product [Owenia fusiformis]